MPPTIREVAHEAGVSIATVSHALSGKRPVSAETQSRIRKTARRLGYRPNRVAAAMITGRTSTLGMIVPDIGNPFFGQLVAAAERGAAARGYTLVVCSSELDAELESRYARALHDRRVDGLIYVSGTNAGNSALLDVARSGVPIVALDEELDTLPPGCSLLTVANTDGGALAAGHLLELGHGELGVLTGPADLPTARERAAGFVRASRRGGVRVPKRRVAHAPAYTVEAGRETARILLQDDPGLTALFCGNDLIALGVVQAAEELGRRVPRDLSVVGFDDIFVAALVRPGLTTIRQPLAQLGKEAAELAIALVEGRDAASARRVLPVELVVRDSTARPTARARALAAAGG